MVLCGADDAGEQMIASVTETQIFTALRAFILGVVDCEVIRVPNNRVPMPVGEFISLSAISNSPLSTNVSSYSSTEKSIIRPSQFTIQVDCYGASAGDRATAITTLFRDAYGCDALAPSGIQPLYASDARQMPMVDGESQYVTRYTFDAVMQFNPVLTVSQQSANELQVGIKEVDRAFPP